VYGRDGARGKDAPRLCPPPGRGAAWRRPFQREPMIFTFDTTHHALWAEEVAREAEIPAQVIPAPPAARARCDLALETLPEEAERLTEALREAGVPFGSYPR
jgi:hypothetical protein